MLSKEEIAAAKTLFNYLTVHDKPQVADVIIGCGTYSLGAAVKAAELWHAGLAPYIIFTGYKNDRHVKTEAEMLRDEAVRLGVPKSVIFIENKASNTGLNMTLSYELAKGKGLLTQNKVILIHKPYMSRRTFATFKAQWPDPSTTCFVVPSDVTLEEFFEADGAEQTIRSMLADFYCIKAYPEKGWQIVQAVTPEAEAASQYLISHGYELKIPGASK